MAETATAGGLAEDRGGDLGGDRDGRPTVPSGVALLAVAFFMNCSGLLSCSGVRTKVVGFSPRCIFPSGVDLFGELEYTAVFVAGCGGIVVVARCGVDGLAGASPVGFGEICAGVVDSAPLLLSCSSAFTSDCGVVDFPIIDAIVSAISSRDAEGIMGECKATGGASALFAAVRDGDFDGDF